MGRTKTTVRCGNKYEAKQGGGRSKIGKNCRKNANRTFVFGRGGRLRSFPLCVRAVLLSLRSLRALSHVYTHGTRCFELLRPRRFLRHPPDERNERKRGQSKRGVRAFRSLFLNFSFAVGGAPSLFLNFSRFSIDSWLVLPLALPPIYFHTVRPPHFWSHSCACPERGGAGGAPETKKRHSPLDTDDWNWKIGPCGRSLYGPSPPGSRYEGVHRGSEAREARLRAERAERPSRALCFRGMRASTAVFSQYRASTAVFSRYEGVHRCVFAV